MPTPEEVRDDEMAELTAEVERLRKQCVAWARAVHNNCDRETSKEIFDAQKTAFEALSRDK